ncbi:MULTISPECIES: hypothetical protein [Moraxella]|jgi:hypothetical protein|nr:MULTISPECIES: hypothetical protein [Moraxella]MBE9579510.1 hypothetical protein [Moraxella sp. K1664]MBE9588570.1 hypothetical protein [Moraxella sp. K1630]MBE9589957.1 hypothetical protein [Moraxella sp. K127]MBE9596729.1 hypothetical protein [Moraxella sp. K2450]MDH9218205.1 hypothetical protein [Moraxella lacunata]
MQQIQNDINLLIAKKKALMLNDPIIYEIWYEMIKILTKNKELTFAYLKMISQEEVYWISEIFEDLSEEFQDESFISLLNELQDKYPSIDLSMDILYSKKAIK